jgi:hypothetical protein
MYHSLRTGLTPAQASELPRPASIEYGRAMKMDVIATTKRSVAIALGLVLVIGLLLLAWIGSELHYGNCLTKEHQAGKTGESCSHFP